MACPFLGGCPLLGLKVRIAFSPSVFYWAFPLYILAAMPKQADRTCALHDMQWTAYIVLSV